MKPQPATNPSSSLEDLSAYTDIRKVQKFAPDNELDPATNFRVGFFFSGELIESKSL